MTDFHIIVDSGATLPNPRLLSQYPVTVVPNRFAINGQVYREGVDISQEDLLRLMSATQAPAFVTPPTPADFATAYTRAARTSKAILSLHTSRELSQSWHNGRQAARLLTDSRPVAHIDSQTLCVGLGMLVRVAAQALQQPLTFEAFVQQVRGAVGRLFTLIYVESLETLQQRRLMSESRALLAAMTGVKPFVSIEEGQLRVTEKVRSRVQAVERLAEFVAEFEELEDAAIIHHRPLLTEPARMLQERLSVDFPAQQFPSIAYGASLAAWIGQEATGVVILEKEGSDYYHGDD